MNILGMIAVSSMARGFVLLHSRVCDKTIKSDALFHGDFLLKWRLKRITIGHITPRLSYYSTKLTLLHRGAAQCACSMWC